MKSAEEIEKQVYESLQNHLQELKEKGLNDTGLYAFEVGYNTAANEYASQSDLHKPYNEKYCIGYPISSLELQREKFKQIFGHSDAYTIEQYVNGLIELVQRNAAQDRWVKVSDVEPEIDVPYNIVYSGVVQWVAYKFDGENWVDMHDIAPDLPKNDVSHYQLLPTPPKD